MHFGPVNNLRFLSLDDNPANHVDFRIILGSPSELTGSLDKNGAALFRDACKGPSFPTFEIDSAYQEEEGLELVEKSLEEGRPDAMPFVDVRMSPGWEGVETTCQIWRRYPDLQVVLCPAYRNDFREELVRPLGDLVPSRADSMG